MSTPRLTDEKRQVIAKEIAKGGSNREIAARLGVSIGTVSNVRTGAWAGIRITELEKEITLLRAFKDIRAVPMDVPYKKNPTRHEAVPFLLASDWHIDETVNAEAMNGLNEYTLSIAQERVKAFFKCAADIIGIYKHNSDVRSLVIAALGDFASCWLHDELVETNGLTPPQAVLQMLDMWTGGIDFLLSQSVVEDILFVGTVGNHGRITKKPQAKNRAIKNYEWILYSLLARYYAAKDERRIKFQLPCGYFNWVSVFDRHIRCHHGDSIKYQGGIGGVHIPLRKAIGQWNKARRADLDLLGHWHQCERSKDYVINGSLIGYNEYAEIIKADPGKAQQCIFLLHQKYGPTGFYPIVVQ